MTSSLEFYLRQVNTSKVCITSVFICINSWCMVWNVIDLILCLFCWNFKIFPKLTDTYPKWRNLWNFIFVRSMPLRFVLHSFLFYKLLVFGMNVIDQILCLFCSNFKIFTKLTDTSPKWRHLWNFIWFRSIPLRSGQYLWGLYYIRFYLYKF